MGTAPGLLPNGARGAALAVPAGAALAVPAGHMWSFTALFSDGVRTGSASPTHTPGLRDEDDTQSILSGEDDPRWEANELADIRVDISDIHEAIRNHDLWVQDASAMRNDIDTLQSVIREHEGWMAQIANVVRQLQAKEEALEVELAEIRRQLHMRSWSGVSSSAASAAAATMDKDGDPVPSEPSVVESEKGATMNGDAPDSEIHRLVMNLVQQLNCGLRMIRTMVNAVEGSLVRQLDGERAARRAAVVELRQELVASRQLAAGRPAAPDSGMKAMVDVKDDLLHDPSKHDLREYCEAAIRSVRSSINSVEERASEKSVEAERSVDALRKEMAALRAEQQLQAVAAGALALTSGGLSQQGQQKFLSALGERAEDVHRLDKRQAMQAGRQAHSDSELRRHFARADPGALRGRGFR